LYAFCETHLFLHQWDASQSLRCVLLAQGARHQARAGVAREDEFQNVMD